MYTERDGVRLHRVSEGTGDAVLLIHGHTVDLRIWRNVSGRLVEAGLRSVRYDLRGHGRSSRPDRGYHWTHHAADALAILDNLGIDRCDVAGYSIGGGIALELVLGAPERIDRLALLSPVLPDRPFDDLFFQNLREVARVTRERGIRAAMLGPWMASPLWDGSLTHPAVRDRLEAIVADFPGAEYLATVRDRVERDWTVPERLGEIRSPTMVMVGELELPGFIGFANEMADGIPCARLEVLDGLGHLHLLQDPDLVADRLISFFTEGRGGGAVGR